MNFLNQEFFDRSPDLVARDLIGKTFIYNQYKSIVCETEAYGSQDDEASHAFKGPTARNLPMFGPSGRFYVYFIYGMHHCLNIVTEKEGIASAVLIRSLYILEPYPSVLLNGPGKICKFLNITRNDNNVNCINDDHIYFRNDSISLDVKVTSRLGISKARDIPWRFFAIFKP